MLAYATLGTRDLERAAAFYDAVLAELGGRRVIEQPDYYIAWGNSQGSAGLVIALPFDKQPASVGNGTMAALAATSREQVDRVHRKALELGAADEGAPGQRYKGFYAGYFRDLDGNKLNCCYFGD